MTKTSDPGDGRAIAMALLMAIRGMVTFDDEPYDPELANQLRREAWTVAAGAYGMQIHEDVETLFRHARDIWQERQL